MWVSFFWTQCRVQVTFTRPELRYGPRSNSLRRTSIRPNGEGALASNPHPRILVRHCSECMLLPLPRRILCDRVGFFVVRSICLSVSKVISRFHWNLVSWSDLYQSEELVRASPARRHRNTCPHGVCANVISVRFCEHPLRASALLKIRATPLNWWTIGGDPVQDTDSGFRITFPVLSPLRSRGGDLLALLMQSPADCHDTRGEMTDADKIMNPTIIGAIRLTSGSGLIRKSGFKFRITFGWG